MAPDKKVGIILLKLNSPKLMASNNKDAKPPETGEIIIDLTKGDILGVPSSGFRLTKLREIYHQRSRRFEASSCSNISKIEIEAGFVNGFKINKFVGVSFATAQVSPDGTQSRSVDTSKNGNNRCPAIQALKEALQPMKKTDSNHITQHQGKLIFMGRRSRDDRVTHATLPLKSRVRITNTANNKR